MATKKISELTEVTSPSGTDVFPIVNSGETKKVQLTNCKTSLGITQIETNQGILASLTTNEKTNLVGAINEVDGHCDTNATNITNLQTGWNSANETWTYSSVDDPTGVITISGDKTTKYSLGMRIKFTNGGNTIYGIITKISYTSPNTTLTFLHEINPTNSLVLHLMANSAITLNYYSNMKAPFGFPLNPDKWSIKKTLTTNYFKSNPVKDTIYYSGFNITIPIGLYNIELSTVGYADRGTTGDTQVSIGIANNQTSLDIYFPLQQTITYTSSVTATLFILPINPKRIVEIGSKTVYYLNLRTNATGVTTIGSVNEGETYIKAQCAYL